MEPRVKSNKLEEQFVSYQVNNISSESSEREVREAERAFFFGAKAMCRIIIEAGEKGERARLMAILDIVYEFKARDEKELMRIDEIIEKYKKQGELNAGKQPLE